MDNDIISILTLEVNMDKSKLRKAAIAYLTSLDVLQKQAIIKSALEQLVKLDIWKNAKSIGITYSMDNELPTQEIIEVAQSEGKQVFLPKCMPNYKLIFLPYKIGDKLVKSKFGVKEPNTKATLSGNQIDLIIVPGLRFAKDTRMRIGFGAGYYDRFLATYAGNTVALTTKMLTCVTPDWEVEHFDQAVEQIILGEIKK